MTKTKASRAVNSGHRSQIVLGFDANAQPRAARFTAAIPDLVAKIAERQQFKVYEVSSPNLAAAANKLPEAQLEVSAPDRIVPVVPQSLYSEVVAALVADPSQAIGTADPRNVKLPEPAGLPRSWDEIGPGHMILAEEGAGYGWWEAFVIDRQGELFSLRYRDFPKLPKFMRGRRSIALLSPPVEPS